MPGGNKPKFIPHCLIDCIPVSSLVADTLPAYFKKEIEAASSEYSDNRPLIKVTRERPLVRSGLLTSFFFYSFMFIFLYFSVPKELPYFYVEFPDLTGYAHVIEDRHGFKRDFGREVVRAAIRHNKTAGTSQQSEAVVLFEAEEEREKAEKEAEKSGEVSSSSTQGDEPMFDRSDDTPPPLPEGLEGDFAMADADGSEDDDDNIIARKERLQRAKIQQAKRGVYSRQLGRGGRQPAASADESVQLVSRDYTAEVITRFAEFDWTKEIDEDLQRTSNAFTKAQESGGSIYGRGRKVNALDMMFSKGSD